MIPEPYEPPRRVIYSKQVYWEALKYGRLADNSESGQRSKDSPCGRGCESCGKSSARERALFVRSIRTHRRDVQIRFSMASVAHENRIPLRLIFAMPTLSIFWIDGFPLGYEKSSRGLKPTAGPTVPADVSGIDFRLPPEVQMRASARSECGRHRSRRSEQRACTRQSRRCARSAPRAIHTSTPSSLLRPPLQKSREGRTPRSVEKKR